MQTMYRDRTCYTKHGMHMNSLGKNWMCQEITKKILELLLPKSDNLPKPLFWKAPTQQVLLLNTQGFQL